MRVGKYVASGNKTTVYRYDGQMGMEDEETSPGTSTVTDYAIGARGVDGISTSVNGAASTVAYPIYDAHGNMIATLAKGGSNTYSEGNQRSYDAWGGIRIGNLTGDPKQQYCANLGHRADDETGFIYMRARYYEPSTARFLSEDNRCEGNNWFSYCSNNPISYADRSGKEKTADALIGAALIGFISYIASFAIGDNQLLQLAFAIGSSIAAEYFGLSSKVGALAKVIAQLVGREFMSYCKALEDSFKSLPPPGGIGMVLMIAVSGYAGAIYGELFAQNVESIRG